MPSNDEALLRAALIYDVPTLRGSESGGAIAFLEILDLRTHRAENSAEDPLGIAANGLYEVFSGRAEKGMQRFRELIDVSDDQAEAQLVRLLGLALSAWNDPNDLRRLDEAATEVRSHEDAHLVAMYLMKLAGFAYEGAHRSLARELVTEAADRLPDGHQRLAWRLANLAARWEGVLLLDEAPPEREALADFPWIEDHAAGSAHDALVKEAERRSESPWGRTMYFGMTPLDGATASLLQAEWAGAWWMLSRLRVQHASTALIQGARDTGEWERAAANWILGSGSRIQQVLDSIEPKFGPKSASVLIHDHLLDGRRLDRNDRYYETLMAVWDLLEEDVAAEVLRDSAPPAGDPYDRQRLQSLWAVLGAILPELWAERLGQLEPAQQAAVLPSLAPGLLARLPTSAVMILANRCIQVLDSVRDQGDSNDDSPALASEGTEFYEAAAVLLESEVVSADDRNELVRAISTAPEHQQLELVLRLPQLGSLWDVGTLIYQALEWVRLHAGGAREGTYSMFRRSPVVIAAQASSIFPDLAGSAELAAEIVDLAYDQQLIGDFRSDVLQGLYYLAEDHKFDDLIVGRATGLIIFQDSPFDDAAQEPAFQQGLFDGALFMASSGRKGLASVLANTREVDPRVRVLAIRAIGNVLCLREDEAQEATLLLWNSIAGSLFDPEASVVRQGVHQLLSSNAIPRVLGGLVAQRLVRLFADSGRSVRALVGAAAAHLVRTSVLESPELEVLLTQAAQDRSWLVRDAVLTD